jgi:hypothetical protein
MPCPPLSPLLDHSNYVWWGVQVMKLLIMQLPPISCHMIPIIIQFNSIQFFIIYVLCQQL